MGSEVEEKRRMSDVFPEQKQYQYDGEYRDNLGDDTHVPDAVGLYDRPERDGLSPTIVAVVAIVVLVVLAAVAMLLLI
jgi:hypothetical protein